MAFCNNCGNQVQEGTKYCTICGAMQIASQSASQFSYQGPVYLSSINALQLSSLANTSLVLGIIAMILSNLASISIIWLFSMASSLDGGDFLVMLYLFAIVFAMVSIVGIILAGIGKKKAGQYAQYNMGQVSGKAKAGNVLSSIALPLSIINHIIWTIIGLAPLLISIFSISILGGVLNSIFGR